MDPQNKPILDSERTEELPAQEKIALGAEPVLTLSAEQVYAQRSAESPLDESAHNQGFVP